MPQYPDDVRRRAVAAVMAGKSRRVVSQEMRIARSTISAWAREAGAPAHPPTQGVVDAPVRPVPSSPVAQQPDVADDDADHDGVVEEAVEVTGSADPPPSGDAPGRVAGPWGNAFTAADTQEIPVVAAPPAVRDAPLVPGGPTGQTGPARQTGPAGPVPTPLTGVPLIIRRRRRRPAGMIAAAAVLVIGLVVTLALLNRRPEEVTDSYDQLADAVDTLYVDQQAAYCSGVADVVAGLQVFDRAATASVTHLSVVADAGAVFSGDVDDVGPVRERLVAALGEDVPTTAQREIQAAYGTEDDPEQACLQDQPRRVERVAAPGAPHVADMRTLLETLRAGGGAEDVTNLARVGDAVTEIAPTIARVADERVAPRTDLLRASDSPLTDADLVGIDAQLADAVDTMTEQATATDVLDATALLADYAWAGESLAGRVVVVQGVALEERPSVSTPLVTPERVLRTAVAAIPDGVEAPRPGPEPEQDASGG